MNDVMLDLETMGNNPQAAIVAVGAVGFNSHTGQLGSKFYSTVDLESSVASGGVMDAATVTWWMKQGDVARTALLVNTLTIAEVLSRFSRWINENFEARSVRVWGNGAAFDNVILASAYKNCHMPPPWKYYNDRCYRTLKGMHPDVKIVRGGTYHNALDDAVSQAEHAMVIMRGG